MAEHSNQKISIETLKQLFPIRNLSEEILESYTAERYVENIAAGTVLFNANHPAQNAIYLISGKVEISDQLGKSYEVEAGCAQAKFPLSSGIKHNTTAIAKSDIGILRVSLEIMASTNKREHDALEIPDECHNNRLLSLFADQFQDHDLELPSLPEVAIKLRRAIEKDVSIAEAVKIIQLDPSISAKIIEVANCPLYLTRIRASNCHDAVRRIGLNATRSLVTSLSIKKIFRTKSPSLKKHFESLWKNSLYLSVLCHVLAVGSQQHNPEEALLAGLVSDIGTLPFLSFVANLPVEFINEEEITQALPIIKAPVGVQILTEWAFPQEFIDVAAYSDDWFENTSERLSLTDIVVLSRLHAQIGKGHISDLPAIPSIPAASKLQNLALSPENSLAILHDAKTKISDALRVFFT